MKIDPKIFKAYDVRGKYPDELNEETAFKIAATVGNYFFGKSRSAKRKARIVVGCDARLSSPALYGAVLRGLRYPNKLENVRMKIVEAGTMTTPMLYFLVNKLKADGGIMVTASHNPKEYNGLKIVGKNARPISGEAVLKLLKKI